VLAIAIYLAHGYGKQFHKRARSVKQKSLSGNARFPKAEIINSLLLRRKE
jgi:hypothetical protein